MKRYQRLAKEFLVYHIIETRNVNETEKLFRNIIKEARADVRREEKRNAFVEKLYKRKKK